MAKRILLKASLLFLVFNVLFVLASPTSWLGKGSLYGAVFPHRLRLPWGENAARAHNLTLNNLDAMFATHEISRPKAADEFRVVLIGDSATWGFLLHNEDTLAGNLNALNLRAKDGRMMRFYNLGYPDFSLAKDALILNRALNYQPDLVVWLVTLRSMPSAAQLDHALVQNNFVETIRAVDGRDGQSSERSLAFGENTLFGQRRALADLARLQLYGLPWAATRVDQDYPTYEPLQKDFENDATFMEAAEAQGLDLMLDTLSNVQRRSPVPVLVVNEPMFVGNGENSDVRYNFFYPRWAYDMYRQRMHTQFAPKVYLDLWDAVPPSEFTNSAVHLSPAGSKILAEKLGGWLAAADL